MDTLEPLQLIVGLGNPGPQYEGTRHNAGADFVLELARRHGASLSPDGKFNGLLGRARIANRDVRLLIPTTYMNLSGQAVGPLANFYKIPAEDILVAHDELDLPAGTARLKIGGSGGGNGVRDIIKAMANNKNFRRLRIGIGHPGNARAVADYVLKKPSPDDRILIESSIDKALDVLPALVEGQWNAPMKALHTQDRGN